MREEYLDLPVEPPAEFQPLFVPIPKEYVENAFRSDEFMVLVGPQHPGSGHMRIVVRIKGDVIVDALPEPGYVHRSMEKLAENRLYIHNIPLFERPAIMDSSNYNVGYVRVIEDALDIEVPERAKYIRTIFSELSRIGTHLYDAGILSVFLGHTTGFMWPFGLRELICEANLRATGTRVTTSFIVPGGVRTDVDDGVLKFIYESMDVLEKRLKGFERVFIKNPAVIARLKDVGVLTKEEAVRYGVVGPFLRASGVAYDVRKVEPYDAYDKIEWDVPVGDDGDAYTRFLVRVEEIAQSIKIIRQAIKDIPRGPVISEDLIGKLKEKDQVKKNIKGYFYRIFSRIKPPQGEFTSQTEAGRGLLLYTIISDGESNVPYRVRIVTPGWLYLRGFMESLKGSRLADLQAIYGSFGYFPPEADR